MKKIKVGSRESPLAIAQSQEVINLLRPFYPQFKFEIIKIKTTGDKFQTESLADIGGKALFIKELEEALQNNIVDFAVHSMKDMPALLPEDLEIVSVPKRREAEDVFISFKYKSISELPMGAKFASCSPRRIAQILMLRPDLTILPLRGNILTRIEKVKEQNIDATILALAGIKRINALEKKYYSILNPSEFIPAIGQGALAIQARKDNIFIKEMLLKINDFEAYAQINLERAFLIGVGGDCKTPMGVYSYIKSGKIYAKFFASSEKEVRYIIIEKEGPVSDATHIGFEAAKYFKL